MTLFVVVVVGGGGVVVVVVGGVVILHGPGNSDCDKSMLVHITSRGTGPGLGCPLCPLCPLCGSSGTKLKVTTGCDTTVEMSQARVTRALRLQSSHH